MSILLPPQNNNNDLLEKLKETSTDEIIKSLGGIKSEKQNHQEIIKKRDDWGQAYLRESFRKLMQIVVIILTIIGCVLFYRYICLIWEDKNKIESILSSGYSHFLGAIIAIYFDRLVRK